MLCHLEKYGRDVALQAGRSQPSKNNSFAGCGAVRQAKIFASLKIKNGISFTPLNCALKAILVDSLVVMPNLIGHLPRNAIPGPAGNDE